MDFFSPTSIKEKLSKYGATASKGLGQNFLINKDILEKIIQNANIKNTDTILEVGPGLGVLTKELANRGGQIVAVEKSETMCQIINETLKDLKNIKIINADILKFNPTNYKLQANSYKIVANIPYYLTSPLIRKFLESENQPKEIILMIQKEVAQRICATPPNMNLLAVSVQFYAKSEIISFVSKNCFWPAPKIDSAIIKITPIQNNTNLQPDNKLFFKIVKAGFSQPRKQLVNNLTSLKVLNGVKLDKEKVSNWLIKNNLKPTQRAETLNLSDWINLSKNF
jgi:16S rRNA (adenine1518-N6/adenine1519-N6)-dimethyltransferase